MGVAIGKFTKIHENARWGPQENRVEITFLLSAGNTLPKTVIFTFEAASVQRGRQLGARREIWCILDPNLQDPAEIREIAHLLTRSATCAVPKWVSKHVNLKNSRKCSMGTPPATDRQCDFGWKSDVFSDRFSSIFGTIYIARTRFIKPQTANLKPPAVIAFGSP